MGDDEEASGPDPCTGLLELAQQVGGKIIKVRKVPVYAHFASLPDIARWSTVPIWYRDHGYRQTAGGFHQFHLNNPPIDNQLAHFFPVPPTDVLED